MCLCKIKHQGGVSHHFAGVLTSLKKYRAICGIAAIVSQYRGIWVHKDPCPSFPCFFWKRGKPTKKTRIFIPTEPLKSLEKKGQTLEKTRNSSQGEKKQGIPKKQGKEGQGLFREVGFRVAIPRVHSTVGFQELLRERPFRSESFIVKGVVVPKP